MGSIVVDFFNQNGFSLLSLLVFITLIRKLTKEIDASFDESLIIPFSNFLLKFRQDSGVEYDLLDFFYPLFNKVYGEKHWNIKCFARSSAISIFIFVILSVSYFFSSANYIQDSFSSVFILLFSFLLFSTFSIIFNVVIDYISLFQTRLILKARINICFKIFLDFFITFFLALSWYAFVVTILLNKVFWGQLYWRAILDGFFNKYQELIVHVVEFFSGGSGQDNVILIFMIATTFSTSFLLWLYALSALTLKVLLVHKYPLRFLNVKKSPYQSVGTIVNAYIIGFYFLFFLL